MHIRDYKNFAQGSIYHIYNRGDNKEVVFRDEQDYRAFLYRLGLALDIPKESLNNFELTRAPKSRIRIAESPSGLFKLYAFCLMPNHFHLLIEQCGDVSISNLMLKVCTSFSRYINIKYSRVGHVFQDQFKSVRIESNSQLMLFCSYIHMNPVKDGIASFPEKYKWSSYNSIIRTIEDPVIDKEFLISIFGNKEKFIKETNRLYSRMMSKVPFDILDVV